MSDDNETWKLNQGFSNATNSPPPADPYQRSVWEYNTRQAAAHDSSNIPGGHYNGIPINMPDYSSGGGGAFNWSELSGPERRDRIIALIIAALFGIGLCIFEKKPMTSIWDGVAVFVFSLIVLAFSFLILRTLSNVIGLLRKIFK